MAGPRSPPPWAISPLRSLPDPITSCRPGLRYPIPTQHATAPSTAPISTTASFGVVPVVSRSTMRKWAGVSEELAMVLRSRERQPRVGRRSRRRRYPIWRRLRLAPLRARTGIPRRPDPLAIGPCFRGLLWSGSSPERPSKLLRVPLKETAILFRSCITAVVSAPDPPPVDGWPP